MKKRNGTNQSLWRRTVWLLLWLLMLPSVTALAGSGMDNKNLWTVMQSGTNTIKITVPVYDEEGKDGWVSKGYLYVTPEGGSKETVLNFYSKEKSGDRCHLFIKRAVNGNMTLTRDGGLSSGTIGTANLSNCRVSALIGSTKTGDAISGLRLNGKPSAPGIYINNGRKIVVK